MLAVTVAVWDLSSESSLPIATRHVVLGVTTLDAAGRGIVGIAWESERRFITVGSSGLLEFELCGAPGAFVSNRPASVPRPTIRYRALLKPDEVLDASGSATELTCIAFCQGLQAGTGAFTVISPPQFAVGDVAGGVWVVRKDLGTDSHFVSRVQLPTEGEAPSAVLSVCWRKAALIAGSANGSICAWDVPQGVSCFSSGCLSLAPA